MGEPLLSVDDLATHLGVSRRWIYERTRTYAIPHRRFGRTVRFTPADVAAIEKQHLMAPVTRRGLRSTA